MSCEMIYELVMPNLEEENSVMDYICGWNRVSCWLSENYPDGLIMNEENHNKLSKLTAEISNDIVTKTEQLNMYKAAIKVEYVTTVDELDILNAHIKNLEDEIANNKELWSFLSVVLRVSPCLGEGKSRIVVSY